MSINNILDKSSYSCTGCSACALICNQGAITFMVDSDGFYTPVIDESKCINCGACKAVCYKYLDANQFDNYKPYKDSSVIAVINNFTEQMHTVSSAGVATVIAKKGFADGLQVVGVHFDGIEGFCYHHVAESITDVKKFTGSKYLQSRCFDAFKQVISEKHSIVFGTPCQIYGLRKVLQKMKLEDNVLLVDLFCAGVPSQNLWVSYVKFLETTFGLHGKLSVNFRDKTQGWHRFSLSITDENGNTYRQNLYNDIFFRFYLQKKCMNRACYDCIFRCKNFASSDIRLGDFWGEKYTAFLDGVELMVINTDKGKKYWDKIRHLFHEEECKIDDVFRSQRIGEIPLPENYSDIFGILLERSLEEI